MYLSRGLSLAALAATAQATSPTVTLASGVLVGTTTTLPRATAPVNQFLGVPFADSPPVRFEPPQPPKPWSKPLQADKRSAACVQKFAYPEAARNFSMAIYNNPFGAPPSESEDCLYLNVFAPSTPAPKDGRAVMFWIFGGGLNFGTANLDMYDGSSFAANQDVVIVAANYRTNAFGFPLAPQLPADKRNLGFLDQQFALKWVQDNIAAFGGDPAKVTLFGESAGATSIDDLLLANRYVDHGAPFRAAILESGQDTFGPLRSNKGNGSAWPALVAALGCGADANSSAAFACVQNAPAATIKSIAEHQDLSFIAAADGGATVADHPLAQRAAGRVGRGPGLPRTNAQEGRVFQVGQTNLTAFLAANFAPFPATIAAVAAAYPVAAPATAYDVISAVWTDYLFTCAAKAYAEATSAAGVPTWRYYYNATFANINPLPAVPLGVYHSSEIAQVFGTYNASSATGAQVALSAYMQKAWADFAKDPFAGPGWASVDMPPVSVVELGVDTKPGCARTFDPRDTVDKKCEAFKQAYDAENNL